MLTLPVLPEPTPEYPEHALRVSLRITTYVPFWYPV